MLRKKGLECQGLINIISALMAGALISAGRTTSNVDADMFNLWLKQDLIPKLPLASVIVMDNATFHKRSNAKVMIACAG